MRKIVLIEVLVIFLLGLVPLLWYRFSIDASIGSVGIISNSDSFPLFLNSHKTLSSATFLWSESTLGSADLMPAFILYQYLMASLGFLGFSVEMAQIVFQVIFLMGAGFSMFYLVRVLYPDYKIAPLIAAVFYMFNFFVMQSRLNVGLVWIYAFIPLLMALLMKSLIAACEGQRPNSNKAIICFSITFMVACSFASINPTNIALMLFALAAIAIYGLFKYRASLKRIFLVFSKIILISISLSIWWLLPLLNVYFFSPQMLNSQINVASWAWTQSRSSFLNLFWFNGIWGWLPEYVPYITAYTGLILILVFIPFIVGASALLFKSNKSKFNLFLMVWILIFLFLAKGVHGFPIVESDLINQINNAIYLNPITAALYAHVPFMNMFREPASKFTMLVVLFLSPLIGFAAARLSNISPVKLDWMRLGRFKKSMKFVVPILLIAVFMISTFPMLTNDYNPLETKTDAALPVDGKELQVPFNMSSSYVQLPAYWLDASSWINSQNGDGKVLFTPLDDFYQMPYTWGYYGVDQLFSRLIEKPIVSTDYLYSYLLKPNTVTALQQLQAAVANGNTVEFRAFLDLLNIQYILQRNDVISDTANRSLMSPQEMKSFFSLQPYLRLVKSFGDLDIYEYLDVKPSVYVFSQKTLNQTLEAENLLDSSNLTAWKTANELNANLTLVSGFSSVAGEFTTYEEDLRDIWQYIDSPEFEVISGVGYKASAAVSTLDDWVEYIYLNVTEHLYNGSLRNGVYSGVYGPDQEAQLEFIPDLNVDRVTIKVGLMWNHTKPGPSEIFSLDKMTITYLDLVLNEQYSDQLFAPSDVQAVTILRNQKIDPTETLLRINATKPFVIATSQALDRNWVATVNGEQIKPSPLYLGIEGFFVNETGLLDVTIQYQPQIWFTYCSIISFVTFILCSVFLLILFLKRN